MRDLSPPSAHDGWATVQLTSACMSYIVLRWSQMTLDGTWRPIFWLNLSRIQIMWKCRFTPERQDSGLRVRAQLCAESMDVEGQEYEMAGGVLQDGGVKASGCFRSRVYSRRVQGKGAAEAGRVEAFPRVGVSQGQEGQG